MLYLIPLLQSKLRFSGNLLGQKRTATDPRSLYIGIGIVALFFIAMILFNKLSGGNSNFRQYKRVFKKKAKELHLSPQQIKLLISLIHKADIKKPLMVLSHPENLNSLLRRAIREIRKESIPESVKQNRITGIYRIKHHLDKYHKSAQMRNTHDLRVGTKVIIERSDRKSFTTSVIGNYENFFGIKMPIDSIGNQIRWKKGSPIKVIAFDRNDKESHFLSKTLGVNHIGKANALLVAHTLKTSNIARSFQRVDVSLSTYIYPLEKKFDPHRKQTLLKPNKNSGRIGKVLDLSCGGCSLTTKIPYSEGSMIELDFDLDDNHGIVLHGKVLKNRIARGRKITHIKFTRASASNLNKINNFIYGLG